MVNLRMASIWAILVMLFPIPSHSKGLPTALLRCPAIAFATADNDIRLDGDKRSAGRPVPLPATVENAFRSITLRSLRDLDPKIVNGLTCRSIVISVFRVSIPERRFLFIETVGYGVGGEWFVLVGYDPASKFTTQKPVVIGAKWPNDFYADGDRLAKPPFVSSADLFRDGHRQVVFEERVHNGNMYNAAVYHYFEVGPHLELTGVFALETNVLALRPDEGIFVRTLTRLDSTHLRVDTIQSSENATQKKIGYAIFQSPKIGEPFRVAEHHPAKLQKSDMYSGPEMLVTWCVTAKSEDEFLRKGCDFYY